MNDQLSKYFVYIKLYIRFYDSTVETLKVCRILNSMYRLQFQIILLRYFLSLYRPFKVNILKMYKLT